jgi:hypothetical protein
LALHFSDYSFRIYHLVNQDDRQLLAHAMAYDFSVPWHCLSKRTIVFFVTDQTPRPYLTRSLPAQLDFLKNWHSIYVIHKMAYLDFVQAKLIGLFSPLLAHGVIK